MRPESAQLFAADAPVPPDGVALPAVVEAVGFVGSQVHVHLRLEASNTGFVVTTTTRHGLPAVGDAVRVGWSIDDGRILGD